MPISTHQAVFLAHELTRLGEVGDLHRLSTTLFDSRVDLNPHQIDAALFAISNPLQKGVLLADEVGLGKTIEAGLVWTELRSRYDARNLVVVCPAMLRQKWKDELLGRFGVRAQIVDTTGLLQLFLEAQRGTLDGFVAVCSMQGLRPPKDWDNETDAAQSGAARLARFLNDNAHDEPLIDLLIVDEAHYMRNQETATNLVGRLLRGLAEHVALLSATPIHLKNRDLYQLLNLVDEDSFNQPHVFDDILEANEPLIEAREKILRGSTDLESFLETLQLAKSFPLIGENRQLNVILSSPPNQIEFEDPHVRSRLAAKLERINLLGKVVNRTRKREVTEWRVIREAVGEKVAMTPIELAFYLSVTELVRTYCLKQDAPEGFLLATPQRQISSSMPAALREWQRRRLGSGEQLYEDIGVEAQEGDIGPLVHEIVSNINSFGSLQELWQHDSKYNRLSKILKQMLTEQPKELQERLEQEGIRGVVLVGGMEDKHQVLESFKDPRGPSILLASEVASEGVDLQFSRMVINYDLPWNPMKVEQRIGRIDRLGQKAPKITIWNLFYQHTIDERIYDRLYMRLGIFQRALGGLEAVLGEQIKTLTQDLLRGNLSEEQEADRINQTAQAVAILREQEEKLEDEASKLVAHGDYILNQVNAARQLGRWINGEDIWMYIRDHLNEAYQGCSFKQLKEDELEFDILLSEKARFDLGAFLEKNRLKASTRLAAESVKPVRCRFDNSVGENRFHRVEMINQYHPLLRFVSRNIRERIEAQETVHHPCVSLELAGRHVPELPRGVFVYHVDGWSVQGVRSVEKLDYQVKPYVDRSARISEEQAELLITTAARFGEDWYGVNALDRSRLVQLIETCIVEAEDRYEMFITDLENENNDRADMQENSIRLHMQRQNAKFEQTLAKLRQKGHDKMIAPTLGRMQRFEERVRHKLMEIDKRRHLTHHHKTVSIGVINVH